MFPDVGSTDMGAFEVSYGGEMFPVMVAKETVNGTGEGSKIEDVRNIDGGVWVEMGERVIWEGRE